MIKDKIISLEYGSGGESYHRLVQEVFVPYFANPELIELGDAAICAFDDQRYLAMTTDAFVVKPLFFPGGDIGSLSVCGTINDLAMSGAKPLYLTCSMIIEAGFAMEDLQKICSSMAQTAKNAGVKIVAGDTKVVEKNACDGIFITTTGVGIFPYGYRRQKQVLATGDKIIISGDIACHGMAVMAARHNLHFEPQICSDVAPLDTLSAAARSVAGGVKLMRDPTRGGISGTLNEWADEHNCAIIIKEEAVPMSAEIAAACNLLGIDPFHVANEGKMVVVASQDQADAVLAAMQKHPLGTTSAIVGEIDMADDQGVYALTEIGSKRIVRTIDGEQLPRIC